MKTFTVHARDETGFDEAADETLLIKEGFCWPALFIPLLWLLWRRMWLPALGWLAVVVALSVSGTLWPGAEDALGVAALALGLWLPFEANALRRWSLSRKGWAMIDVVSGRDRWEAELSHFRRVEAGAYVPRQQGPYQPRRTGRAARPVVGGLFPEGNL